MKPIAFFVFTLLISPTTFAQEISPDQIAFVRNFTKAVQDNRTRKILSFLDKDYRKTQSKFLDGAKEQLLNELFNGKSNGVFVGIPITEILKIEVAEIQQEKDGSYAYIFRVRSANHDIVSSLQLIKKGRRFGFVGASG